MLDLSQVLPDPNDVPQGTKCVASRERRMIYCFTERGEEVYPFTGLGGASLETITYGEIAAVVSRLKITRFDQESILKHQEVNSRLFSTRTVVPVMFGTIADEPILVKELLQKTYLQVKAALKRLERKIELVVRVSWDLRSVFQEVKRQIPIESCGAGDLQKRIAVGRQVFEAVGKKKKAIINRIHNRLYSRAADFSARRMHEGEEVILDHSYLVERVKEPLFDGAVQRIANEYEETLNFKCIGPLPPYSFARLTISGGNFEAVDEARKTLDLPERASHGEIRSCYRRLSLACHPDRNRDDPKAEELFRNLTRAYEILKAYCENNPWLELEEDRTFSFTRDDVERSVMVRSGSR